MQLPKKLYPPPGVSEGHYEGAAFGRIAAKRPDVHNIAHENHADAIPDVPIVIGASGLTGRPTVRPPESELEPEQRGTDDQTAIPAPCLRNLSSPRGECRVDCPGVQRDGSCLCDIVRAANEQGVPWRFEIDAIDGVWEYMGPPLQP